ncbi:MAG: hypothetical protein AAGB11_20050 [Pseudomonadota bacterium]
MRINFDTARDVLLAFPTLGDDIETAPDDRDPLAFTRALLSSETPEDCLSFFAYLAPRREAVWWCCRCLEALGQKDHGGAMQAAMDWVRMPENDQRRRALDHAEASNDTEASTWAAFAAGWSGGNISDENSPPVLAAPQLTAKAVRASVLIAVSRAPFNERRGRLERCLDEAMNVANDDAEKHFG